MTDNIPTLIAEARELEADWGRNEGDAIDVARRLADALEATERERSAAKAYEDVLQKLLSRARGERSEAAQLSHQYRNQAERYRAALVDARAEQRDYTIPHDEALSNIGTILHQALNGGETDD